MHLAVDGVQPARRVEHDPQDPGLGPVEPQAFEVGVAIHGAEGSVTTGSGRPRRDQAVASSTTRSTSSEHSTPCTAPPSVTTARQ